MNDRRSPQEHMDVERRSSSPKRKKIRQKYAPKACVSCRRSKLKCSGENPCQRCIDNGKRCFFSEDQTAAEALQNLSRLTPTHTPSSTLVDNNNLPSRNPLPRNEALERRESDVSMADMPLEARMARLESTMDARMSHFESTIDARVARLETTMDARMARIEMMMEAIMHDRGMSIPPLPGGIDRNDSNSDGFRYGSSFDPVDPINPALAHIGQQSTYYLPMPPGAPPPSDHSTS
ncbi:hypothetical protein IAQ61_001301 [Plenodomus lingam]|uniref:Zn(2)-C6 fungal-type domain-containing protein n=1 Tax=Leptosphaeria maculans (strain JN3 / isolate v23.1.3 / race Av1-4-5-6-7-8) TaxID=985895 RepID=E4ZXM4_LEPMJ|nr:hypothetical protein LEMA_P110380.1 [Plenodomus lingam JN3]KAH9879483.1 hypothetical protein IAQ61_001301 [Plenodomus lingam]CBX96119.1 hypothetical protein LEMA_P110380.1 [Plenodomus lingam JN3]